MVYLLVVLASIEMKRPPHKLQEHIYHGLCITIPLIFLKHAMLQ